MSAQSSVAIFENFPPVIFGTSVLGNLFVASDDSAKLEIVKECIRHAKGPVVFDSAGKYGAGLALESLGKSLKELGADPAKIIISNKLGWVRTPLTTEEPTFEPGVWKNLHYDAVQKISYEGILECFQEGNELLNGYHPQLVSVHDPDEYLAAAKDDTDATRRYQDILDAYRALHDLKKQGKVQAIGVGAKDWKSIQRIAADVALDWIMIANSMTIKTHPKELADFIKQMSDKGVLVINSAVFHSGFLIGGNFYDYHAVEQGTTIGDALLKWRTDFFEICKDFDIKPAEACVQYGFRVPGVKAVALNTSDANRVKQNVSLVEKSIPQAFWQAMVQKGLLEQEAINNL